MRAITICMLVALTISGTTLLAQEPGEEAKPDKAKEPGLVKTSTWDWEGPEVSSVMEGVGTLGISVWQMKPRLRHSADVPEGMGVMVWRVDRSGPGEQAGLRFGDYILKIDDQWISNTYQFKALIRHLGPGHKAKIHVRRSSMITAKVTDDGEVRFDPPKMVAKDYIFEATLEETDGAPLVDPVEPMDWSKPTIKTIRHKGLTFNFKDLMLQAINAEGVIRYQGRYSARGYGFMEPYLPQPEFADLPEYFRPKPNPPGTKLLSVGYALKEDLEDDEKPKDDEAKPASKDYVLKEELEDDKKPKDDEAKPASKDEEPEQESEKKP